MRGLIFDLRGNGGGYLREAVMIADKFLNDDQLVVYQEGRKGSPHERRKEDGGPRIAPLRRAQPKHPDYPLVFLVDENTASASEIVSGALQHHQRAVLVGARTFGKGSVQLPHTLSDGGIMRVTIARWYTPLDRSIDGSGLEPDEVVELTEEDRDAERDPQLDAALAALNR